MIALILALGLSSTQARAAADPCALARPTVQKYLALDGRGETTHSSKKLRALVSAKDGEARAFDSMVIISDSQIVGCKPVADGLDFELKYEVLGEISGPVTKAKLKELATAKPKPASDSFAMVRQGNKWLIDSASIGRPHVKLAAAKKLTK